jgi:putative toxin-antitoxin system antitoxin component (TIGR02293 family)
MEATALSDDALIRKVLTVFSQKSLEKVHGGGKKQIATVIKSGLSFKAGVNVKEQLGLSDKEIAETIGTSEKTLQRRKKKGEHFTMVESDRLFRMTRIFALACEVLKSDDRARKWLHRPQFGLGGEVPIEMMKTESGAKDVEELLYRIAYGDVA